jgi:hypothetical protein
VADFALGNAGAGLGAIAATLKGGLGTASAYDSVWSAPPNAESVRGRMTALQHNVRWTPW